MNLKTKYLGLELKSPLIASSSPLTAGIVRIRELEEHGIGAVVLKSIFEEQITGEVQMLEQYNSWYSDTDAYLKTYVGSDYMKGFVQLIRDVKKETSLPVIASINCGHLDKWVEYARKMEEAGADALELNIFFLPTKASERSDDIEERYLKIVSSVVEALKIPVSVKLSMRFTNVLRMIQEIYNRGAKGVVLFNRFFEPDIDIETMDYIPGNGLSSPAELHNTLRNLAMASAVTPEIDLSVSTGVHSGEDVVKSILAGANTVQLCSSILLNGMKIIGEMNKFVSKWMDRNTFDDISDFTGLMNKKVRFDDDMLSRVQYMKYFPKE